MAGFFAARQIEVVADDLDRDSIARRDAKRLSMSVVSVRLRMLGDAHWRNSGSSNRIGSFVHGCTGGSRRVRFRTMCLLPPRCWRPLSRGGYVAGGVGPPRTDGPRLHGGGLVTVPKPMAVDGETAHDPVSRSVLVKVSGFGASFWRRGHRAMVAAEEAYGAPSVYAHAPGRRDIARGEPVRDGWLRFKVDDQVYRELTSTSDLSAIVTVDRDAGRIMGVKFRSRS
jgi:hypothetical protein